MAITVRHNGTGKGKDKVKPSLAVVALDYGDMLDLISTDGVHHKNISYHANATRLGSDGPSWYGGLTDLESAKSLILQGWRDGAGKAQGMANALVGAVPAPESIRRRWTVGETGEALITERALFGDWETAWRRQTRVRTYGSKIVTLVASFGGNCDKSAEELFWSGAQLVVAIDLLEQAGYRVEAHAVSCGEYYADDPRGLGVVDVTVKAAEEPLRIDALMSLTSHAGVFRTYGFMAICRMPWHVGLGLGSHRNPKHILPALIEAGLYPQVDNVMQAAYNRDSAVRNILTTLRAVTGEGESDND